MSVFTAEKKFLFTG